MISSNFLYIKIPILQDVDFPVCHHDIQTIHKALLKSSTQLCFVTLLNYFVSVNVFFPTFGLVIKHTNQAYALLYHLELYYDIGRLYKIQKQYDLRRPFSIILILQMS